MSVIEEIHIERERQKTDEGWSDARDSKRHIRGELARAAASYAIHAALSDQGRINMKFQPNIWPWSSEWWKPKDRRRDLIRAAALIVAEIERLDRKPPPPESE